MSTKSTPTNSPAPMPTARKKAGLSSSQEANLEIQETTFSEAGMSMSLDLAILVKALLFASSQTLPICISASGMEHWLGLNNIFYLTNRNVPIQLKITMENFSKETRVATYDNFYLEDQVSHSKMTSLFEP